MKMAEEIPASMLAPCGINCAVCSVRLRAKKACLGCRGPDEAKPDHCRKCRIMSCAREREVDFCSDCSAFPCAVVRRLDKSYRQRYQVSLIENARRLKAAGPQLYLQEERERWLCQECGGVVCLHTRICSECGRGAS